MPEKSEDMSAKFIELQHDLYKQMTQVEEVQKNLDDLKRQIRIQLMKVEAAYGAHLVEKTIFGGSSNG